ncbi:MAG TPA: alpha-xenorhabdolysin family binary toxin subunit A [Pseudomonas sp.]|jgi:hypothetical protein|uniref:alpha-xenorhabdolysin family binary toxin subunit A n=1 Tax=Pseudomonas sp. TaxID=306 RepID=UPI002ED99939
MRTVEKYNEQTISLEDGFERPIENVLKVPVIEAIQSYVDISSGANSETTRSPGFFIAQKDIGKIKAFTRYASGLPINLTQIKQYLGYDQSGVPGLEPVDVQTLHKEAQGLADFWADIETRMKQAAANLIVFSTDLNTFGAALIGSIKGFSGYDKYKSQVGDIKAEQLRDIKLNGEDFKRVPSLLDLSGTLVDIIQEHKRNATDLKKRIEYFLAGIIELKDKISIACQAAANHNLDVEFADKIEQLQRLNTQIDELCRTYETFSKYTWVGAWWGPLGLAISASIYGPKAANIREQRDDAIARKSQLDGEVKKIDHVIGSLASFQLNLQHLEMLSMEAISGARNIEDIWLLINSYITASMTLMQKNSNATTLLVFEIRLTSLIEHWIKISDEANKIIGHGAD